MNNKVQHYIDEGHRLLDKKYWNNYDKIVPIRVNDLYGGMELGAFLEVIEDYKEHKDLQRCYDIFEKQGHSGMSASLVASLIYNFCEDGDKIVERLGFKSRSPRNE